MASLEDLLWQTMPLSGARTDLIGVPDYPDGDAPPSLFGSAISPTATLTVTKLGLSDDCTAPKPLINSDYYKEPHEVSIWSWKHAGDSPWIFADVYCRSRSLNYRNYKVLESVEFGFEAEDAKGTLKNCIRLTNLAGKRIELPLTKDFVAYKAAVKGGTIVQNQTDLWKLPAKLDQSLVIAFIYSLAPDKDPQAMTADAARALKDGFMLTGSAAAPVGADVHDSASADVDHPRVLVILSLTTCKQGEDFAPGSIVGSGRIYPHIMVMSSMPLARIEATVRLNRPEKTVSDGPDGEVVPPADITKDNFVSIFGDASKTFDGEDCCSGPINSVLFTDANDMDLAHAPGPPPPFWGNFFSYYLLDAFPLQRDRTFNVVSHTPANCKGREGEGLVVRQIALGPSDHTKIQKLPYQGEFDNLHMAPKMKLHNVKKVEHVVRLPPNQPHGHDPVDLDPVVKPVDIVSLHLDDISMAPFCAHDCLHTHWRWGKDATDPAQCGFDGMVPYAKPGKPLVPDNQTVQLWLRAANQMTYTATVWAFPNQPVANGQWHVIFHHGSAYATDITAYIIAYTAKLSVETLGGQPTFTATDGSVITAVRSWSLMYWRLRWETILVDDTPVLRERIQMKNESGAWSL